MNILFAVNAYPPEIGGAELAAKQIVDILLKKHKVTVITRKINKKRPKYKEKIIEFKTKTSYAFMPNLKNFLADNEFDLYISFGFGKHFFDSIGKFCKKNNFPGIAIFTGGFHTSKNIFFKKFYEIIMAKSSIMNYNKIIVATKKEKKYWEDTFNISKAKTIVIPHNLPNNYSKFKKTNVLKRNKLESNNYIFYIGRLAKNKRPDILIKAYDQSNSKLDLVIAGKSTKDNDLMNLSKNPKIKFLGEVNDDEKKDLMKNCKFSVFPSEYESFGLVILEAVKFGKPILLSNIWAFKELVSNKDFFFENNIDSLKTKIKEFTKFRKHSPKINLTNQENKILKVVKEFEKN